MSAEAKPIIDALKLKRQKSCFELFANESVTLIISGIGKTSALIATTHIATLYPKADIIVNIGIAGAKSLEVGSVVLVNKIIDAHTNREFYPDILIRHQFLEDSISTLDAPCGDGTKIDTELVDMEASGFFEAAAKFFSPHQIAILKVVSDNLKTEIPKKELVSSLLEKHSNAILGYFGGLKNLFKAHTIDIQSIESSLDDVSGLSFTQRHQLKERLIYEALQNR